MNEIIDSEKTFLAKLRESLGIATPWKMARCLGLHFNTYYGAELRGGLPSKSLLKTIIKRFGWAKVAKSLREELEKTP